ncbi:methyltransferase-like protein 25B [Microplitis mediator]|uniref:methyltransferase-like protein 25B n=1 Tax=Microplitis mediator TaxID=375433 RepID=UPI002555034B|nr:methyltransferase-like protein 25B [Microplitis mediator]
MAFAAKLGKVTIMSMCTCEVCESVRVILDNIFKIFKTYGWILDSYIIDFYQDDLWSKLPNSWKNLFKNISIEEFGSWILSKSEGKQVWPLSLLALRQSIKISTINRDPDNKTLFVCNGSRWNYSIFVKSTDNLLKLPQNNLVCNHNNLFKKHIKIKKRYEIENFSEICAKCTYLSKCKCIVDTGAGMGHLARQLSYKYNLSVVCIEQTKELSDLAKKYDEEYLMTIKKHIPNFDCKPSYHLCAKIFEENNIFEDSSSNNDELIKSINEIFESTFKISATEKFGFGFIGLHPCGDLAVTLLKLYVKQPNIKFISIVGCCYMKLTTDKEKSSLGYPLSKYLNSMDNNYLSYAALEVACHAVENYCDKMRSGDYHNLKVHAYRSMLEMLLIKKGGLIMRHGRVTSVKVNEQMTFDRYCELATAKFDDDKKLFKSDYQHMKVEKFLDRWQDVVAFEALRMMLAPLVETAVLLDRFLFLSDHNLKPLMKAEFDPRRSPRNFVLISIK